MKTRWKILGAVDIVALILLFWRMAVINGRADYGAAALENVGQFTVCFILFQIALILGLILVATAIVTIIKKRK